jgi:hypothetical protein
MLLALTNAEAECACENLVLFLKMMPFKKLFISDQAGVPLTVVRLPVKRSLRKLGMMVIVEYHLPDANGSSLLENSHPLPDCCLLLDTISSDCD